MKDIIANPDITVRQAMIQLSKTGKKCLIITDEENMLLGTFSDGDLRKAILNGTDMRDSLESFYQQKPTILVKGKYDLIEAKKLFSQYKFDLIPVVDENGTLKDVLFWESVFSNNESNKQKGKLNVPIVIMAGGMGKRMEPFTKILPKPLVPVHEKPIIEHIIERFLEVGCSEFHLTVNYKAHILKAYFKEFQSNYHISFVEEHTPLGTAGGLHFLDGKFDQSFFVTNCDIIIKADYDGLYEFHKKGGFDLTLVASAKEYVIPYGTCELNADGHLSHINEKPQFDFLINTGMYVLNPDVISLIPENKFYHMTNLIQELKNRERKVGVFPIDDHAWIDVGQWSEYQKAINKL